MKLGGGSKFSHEHAALQTGCGGATLSPSDPTNVRSFLPAQRSGWRVQTSTGSVPVDFDFLSGILTFEGQCIIMVYVSSSVA